MISTVRAWPMISIDAPPSRNASTRTMRIAEMLCPKAIQLPVKMATDQWRERSMK